MNIIIVVGIFFFQAEDGIRGPLVTGVQTCALPISMKPGLVVVRLGREHLREGIQRLARLAEADARAPRLVSVEARPGTSASEDRNRSSRSEERRVGEESRVQGGGRH